jgi:hypothetical protein
MSGPVDAERLQAEADAMALNEAAIARDADALVSISIEERGDLQSHAGCPVYLHGPLLSGIERSRRGYAGRAHIGLVAGWAAGANSPNADALLWFARDVLPKIRARVPGAKLLVTGIGPPDQVLRLAGPSIEFVGSVENLADFYEQVRVVVVPMRFGAGVKIKTIEALQYGVPVVATEVGAEGVDTDDPRVLLVTNDPSAYALHVATLLSDRDAWDDRRGLIIDQVERWEASRDRTLWADLMATTIARGRTAELAIARGAPQLQ